MAENNGPSDTAAAVGGGGATETNTTVEVDFTLLTVASGTDNAGATGASTAQITAENQATGGGGAATEIGTTLTAVGTTTPPSLLPAALLGSILDFVPYQDLRTALLAGKFVAVEVAKQVQTINILRPSELVPAAARRFPNVTEVNCLCLVTEAPSRPTRQVMSVATAMHIVPFLTIFPKLKSAFVGGRFPDAIFRTEYNSGSCISPTGHEVIFRALIEQFCTLFKSGDLPDDLDLRGILPIYSAEFGCKIAKKLTCSAQHEFGSQCEMCRKICAIFPFSGVVRVNEGYEGGQHKQHGLCVPAVDRIRMLKGRPDSDAMFQSDAALDGLLRALYQRTGNVTVMRNSASVRDQEFIKRMEIKGCGNFFVEDFHDSIGVTFLCEEMRCEMRELVSAGFDATLQKARRVDLMKKEWFSNPKAIEISLYPDDMPVPASRKEIWDRSSFEFLLSIGFDLDPDDFILLDPKDEPAVLRRMKERGISIPGMPWGGIEEETGGGAENADGFGALPDGFAALGLADADGADQSDNEEVV